MKKNLLLLLIIIFFLSNADLFAQTASTKITVPLSVSVQESPAKIILHWPSETGISSYTVYRKTKTAETWGTVYANVPGTDSSYTDNNITTGQSFEYAVYKYVGSTFTSLGYIMAGVNVPEIHQKGIIILLVDKNYTTALHSEIRQLVFDMIGDGWQVIRHNVSRTDSVKAIRNMIIKDYNTHTGVTALFILGRIPVPYSGLLSIPPDGHVVGSGNHTGAWPADAYYADLNGAWTDMDVDTTGTRPANQNRIGDGKWDQNMIPSSVELQVGRVDLFNMPAFSPNDTLLIKKYLIKDHDFKIGNITASPRGLIDDNFTSLNLTAQAWRGFSAMFGPQNISSGKDYFTTMHDSSYLWSCGAGAGSFTSCNGIGTSTNFVQDSLKNVFTMLTGSFFGDWDNANNLLRAPLASKGITLASFWGGIPQWHIHHMALGENLGFCTKLTMNNDAIYYTGNFNYATREIHIDLMGDPTLRMHVVKPATNLTATPKSGPKEVELDWQASTDHVVGYNIYRASTVDGQFTKINTNWITITSYTDASPMNGNNVYMVRAVKLETSASGSYYNMSIGTIDAGAAMAYNSINEPIASNSNIDINIYPNPNHGKFNISIETSNDADLNCEVINPLGKVIYNDRYLLSSGSDYKTIDLGRIEKGMYILKISGNNTFVVKQLIIQ
jgi:hypothetical protein